MLWIQLKTEHVNFVWHMNVRLERLQFMFGSKNLLGTSGMILKLLFSLYQFHFIHSEIFS